MELSTLNAIILLRNMTKEPVDKIKDWLIEWDVKVLNVAANTYLMLIQYGFNVMSCTTNYLAGY